MAVMDFTPVQELLGREVCFQDLAFEASFKEHKSSFQNEEFMNQVHLDRFKFGKIQGCAVTLDNSEQLSFEILIDETFYSLNEVKMLFVSN